MRKILSEMRVKKIEKGEELKKQVERRFEVCDNGERKKLSKD